MRSSNISKIALNRESIQKLDKITLSPKQLPRQSSYGEITVRDINGTKFLQRKMEKPSGVVPMEEKQVSRTIKKPEAIPEPRKIKSTPQSGTTKTIKKKKEDGASYSSMGYIKKDSYGYPSSPEISVKNYSRDIKTKKSSSFLSRVYKYFSGESKYIKSGSSRSSSSKSIRSRSSSSPSRATSSRSSSSRSSRSGSSKIRKKK